MRYLKTFERLDNDIEVGDWVALKQTVRPGNSYYMRFLPVPCKVVGIDKRSIDGYDIKLRCGNDEVWWRRNDIEFYSKDKEIIEAYFNAKKYNL